MRIRNIILPIAGNNRQNKMEPDMEEANASQTLVAFPNDLYERLKALPIVDLAPVYGNGVRGRTMSSSSSSWLLPRVHEAGVDTVIDLRTADYTDKFEHKVRAAGMEYHHFAFDSKTTDARDIISGLPHLFNLLDKGGFYIACAMGLHRTDIALAVYYTFHPSVPYANVPELRGHRKEGNLRKDDIACRLNSIMRALTPEDKKALGLPDNYEVEFNRRKKRLFAVNSRF